MNKLEKITQQEQKTREKMAAMQAILKQLSGQRTEQENLQIVQQVRALKLSREELYAFLGGGVLPPALAGALTGDAAPETIYTRRGRPRHNTETETPEDETDTPTEESEELTHEEE